MRDFLKIAIAMTLAAVLATGCGDDSADDADGAEGDGSAETSGDGDGDTGGDGDGDASGDGDGDMAGDGDGDDATPPDSGDGDGDGDTTGDGDGDAGDGDASGDGDGDGPKDTQGTPTVTDDGSGPAAAAAGFYRLGVTATTPMATLPMDSTTIFDVYYSSTREIISDGLGGNLEMKENSGTAAMYVTTLGDGNIELWLPSGNNTPHNFGDAQLREDGAQLYAVASNKIAEAPFNGGPDTAPVDPFLPPFFSDNAGTYAVAVSSAPVIGDDTTLTMGESYDITLGEDGSITLKTNGDDVELQWWEGTDTSSAMGVTITRGGQILIVQNVGGNGINGSFTSGTQGVVGAFGFAEASE